MIRALALCLCLAGPAAAQDGPVAAAEQAAADLDAAAVALRRADGARDRVAALTRTVRAYEDGLAALRDGLRAASLRERALRAELDADSERLSQIVGILLSMQTSPEALVLLHPSGPTATARAGMVVSDVVPGLTAEVEVLRLQLEEIALLRALQESAVGTLSEGLDGVQAARTALSQAVSDRTDLPARLTTDDAAMQALIDSAETLEGFASSFVTVGPAAGEAAFAAARGRLPPPVTGLPLRGFGEADAAGVRRPGLLLATDPRALVTAPWPSTIRYAGPLLDYGNVIILEPESGYLLVLAGLGEVYGAPGEVVDAGAALGLMGGAAPPAGEILLETAGGGGQDRTETLYIELRDGDDPIDPAGWFALGAARQDAE